MEDLLLHEIFPRIVLTIIMLVAVATMITMSCKKENDETELQFLLRHGFFGAIFGAVTGNVLGFILSR